MLLSFGEPAPWFTAPTPSNPEFVFDTAAGRYVLMVFLPAGDPQAAGQALARLAANMKLFDERRFCAFVVARGPETVATARDIQGLRWILDLEGTVSRLFGALAEDGAESPGWMLLDPTLRVIDTAPLASAEAVFTQLARLPEPEAHAGIALHAPVLIAPRIFGENLCRRLVDLHEADGGRFTGVMRDHGDRTNLIMDPLKKRRDINVHDPALVAELRERMEIALFPVIERALMFKATRIERYVVSCYDAADEAVFHPHRDSTTQATAHRKFACSINLNGDFEGGDLRFPEFGSAIYRPPVGGAVVFSCAVLHEATRVTTGRRFAFLPFLYDEAGAAVLNAYERRIGASYEPVA